MKVLRTNNVCKNFDGLQVLRNLSIEVEAGERRLIIGPNGAGKTTLFHIISGIIPLTSGAVYLFEKNISDLPMHHRADLGISQTFQIVKLFQKLTVLENAILSLQTFKQSRYSFHWPSGRHKQVIEQAEHHLKEWGLWDKRNAKVSSLSYGDQRLLDIMLALSNNPPLLLLDEPTSGLALADIRSVSSRINNLSREITIVLIEHNMDVALDLADRVTVLDAGQVVVEGTPADIKRDSQVKRIYLGTGNE